MTRVARARQRRAAARAFGHPDGATLPVFGMAISTAVLLTACSEPTLRGPTGPEVVQIAARCGATVTRFGPTFRDFSDEGLPNVSITLDARNFREWEPKADCVYLELKALGAMAFISGPNGESLLISNGDIID
ncbi:MAG TPA: hypothetical protein VI168_06325 [Croceibacterium sp.]